MTAGTITPYRSAQQAGHDGFPQLMRAEWIKFRSVRGWIIGMVVAGLLMLAVGLLGVQANILSFLTAEFSFDYKFISNDLPSVLHDRGTYGLDFGAGVSITF